MKGKNEACQKATTWWATEYNSLSAREMRLLAKNEELEKTADEHRMRLMTNRDSIEIAALKQEIAALKQELAASESARLFAAQQQSSEAERIRRAISILEGDDDV